MIPTIILDPELGSRYTNTLIAFVENCGLAFVKSPHDIAWALDSRSSSARHQALNAVLAAIEAHTHVRPNMIGHEEFFRWVLNRVEIVDALRAQPIFDWTLHSALALEEDSWRYLAPIFRARIPIDRSEFERFMQLVAHLSTDDFESRLSTPRQLTHV